MKKSSRLSSNPMNHVQAEESNDIYNYDFMYFNYMEECKNYFKNVYKIRGPWTKLARDHIITCIKTDDIGLLDSVYSFDCSVLTDYQIVIDTDDAEEKLVRTDTAIEVLPYEECFDVFYELHKNTQHGNFIVMLGKLENKFQIHGKCLEIFLLNCQICKLCRCDRAPMAFNQRVVLEILKSPVLDEEFSYILFYMDCGSRYIFIRPMISLNEHELSLEMLKIFTDFGPPLIIETKHSELLKKALELLGNGGIKYDIKINTYNEVVINKSYGLMIDILSRSSPGSANWATTCRFTQNTYNQSMQNLDIHNKNSAKLEPYKKLFNIKFPMKYDVNNDVIMPVSYPKMPNTSEELVEKEVQLPLNVKIPSTQESVLPALNHNHKSDETIDITETKDNYISMYSEKKQYDTDDAVDTEMYLTSDLKTKTENDCMESCESVPLCAIKQEQPMITSDMINDTQLLEDQGIVNTTDPEKMLTGDVSDSYTLLKSEFETVDELLIPVQSNSNVKDTEVNKSTNTDMSKGPIITTMNNETKEKLCSVCEKIMLTDYFCYGCQKNTHIFCMTRINEKLQCKTDSIKSFTYCSVCSENCFMYVSL